MTNLVTSFSQSPDPFVNNERLATPFLLHRDMAAKAIVDVKGNIIDPTLHPETGGEQEFNERRKAFLEKERTFCVRGLDLKFQMKWQEILDLDPSIYAEVCKKTAAYFRGFKHVDESLKSWGTDLKDVSGDSYAAQLEQEIDQEPSYICMQLFIRSSDPAVIADCKRKIINYIASKIPIEVPEYVPAKDISPEQIALENRYQNLEEEIKKVLEAKEGGYYKDWIAKFQNLRLFIRYIVADALVAFNQVEANVRSLVPVASLCLETEDRQIVEIVISPLASPDKENFKKDVLHFPLTHLSEEGLQPYYTDETQAITDITCKTNSPLFFKLINVFERWKDVLIQGPMGETIRAFSFYDDVTAQILAMANKSSSKSKQSLGKVLGEYVKSAHDKMLVEESSARQHSAHAAIALTMTACELLSEQLTPSQMSDLIHTMAPRWESLVDGDDETFFSLIAKAFASKISYPVISSFFQLVAYDDLHEHSPLSPIQAWINERGSSVKSGLKADLEEIIQLELKAEKASFYIPFQKNASSALLRLMEHSDEYHNKLKPLLIQLGKIDPKSNNAFEQLWIPQLEDLIPTYFETLVGLLKKTKSQERRIAYFTQFLDLLRSKNQLLSPDEEKKVNAIDIHKAKNAQEFCTTIFQVFGAFKNPSLNKAVYEVLKKTKDENARIQIAKALCQGYLPNAINAYIFTAPKIKKPEEKYQLLATLLSNVKKSPSTEIFPALDLLAHEIELLFQQPQPFPLAGWLAEQLLASQRPKLALKVAECIKDAGQKEKAKNKIQEYMRNASSFYKSKESVAKAFESKNSFQAFANLLRENEVQAPFRESPQDFWRMVITPGLKQFCPAPLSQSGTFYTSCLDLMALFRSGQEDLYIFASNLRDVLKQTAFPISKTFVTALYERQTYLYSGLINYPDLVCELAHLQSLHQIPFHPSSAKILLDFMNQYMEGSPSPTNAAMIFELLSDATLKEVWQQEKDKEALTQLYRKLAAFFIQHQFSYAFAAFGRYSELAQKLDAGLCLALINGCVGAKSCQQFSELSHMLLKNGFAAVKNTWQEAVTNIFIDPSEKQLDEKQLEALALITPIPQFSSSLPVETVNGLLDRLAACNTRSPQFVKSLACSCQIISQNKPQFSHYFGLVKRLGTVFHPELLDSAWIMLKNATLSKSEKNKCFLAFLPKIPYMGVQSLADLVMHCHEFLDVRSTPLEVYTNLFTTLERNWKKISLLKESKQSLESLEKIYNALESTPSFKNSPEEREKIQIAYARCLSSSPLDRKRRQAQNIFYRALKSHFNQKGAEWTPYVIDSFKRVIKNIALDGVEKEFTQLILDHPNHAAGCFLLQKLLPKRSDKSMMGIGKILKCLIEKSNQLLPRDYQQFQIFCSRLDFKMIFHDMTIFCDLPLNLLVLEFLKSENIKNFLDQRSIGGLYFNAYRSICQYYYQQEMFDPELFQKILDRLPEFVRECSEEEIAGLTNVLFPLIHQRFKNAQDFEEYKKYFGQLNDALGMCTERKQRRGETKTVYNISKLFINFINSMLKEYMADAKNTWIYVIILFCDYLKNCALDDPSFKNRQTFNVLVHLSLVCKFFERKQKIDPIFDEEIIEKIKAFPSAALGMLEQFHQKEFESFIEVFRMLFEAWKTESGFVPPAELVDVKSSSRFNRIVIVCTNLLLYNENLEISLRVIFELMNLHFISFATSFIPFTELINCLSECVEQSDSYQKFDFLYVLMHNLFLLETKSDFDDGKENPAYRALMKAYNKFFDCFLRSVDTLDVNEKFNCGGFMITYPNILKHHISIFNNKQKSLEKILRKIFDFNMRFFAQYRHEGIIFLDNYIKTLVDLSPSCSGLCAEMTAESIKQFIATAKKLEDDHIGFYKRHAMELLCYAESYGVFTNSQAKLDEVKAFIEHETGEIEKEKNMNEKEKEPEKTRSGKASSKKKNRRRKKKIEVVVAIEKNKEKEKFEKEKGN